MENLIDISFGSSAAIVTSMALIVGLSSINTTKASLIAGLLVIAIADNISDSFGIHIFQESKTGSKAISNVVITNYVARLLVSLSFIPIVLYLANFKFWAVLWGMFLLSILSFFIARNKKTSPIKEIIYHLILAIVVIMVSQYLGGFIKAKIQ